MAYSAPRVYECIVQTLWIGPDMSKIASAVVRNITLGKLKEVASWVSPFQGVFSFRAHCTQPDGRRISDDYRLLA